MAEFLELMFHHRACIGEQNAAAGKDFQKSARIHGLRGGHGVHIEGDCIVLVDVSCFCMGYGIVENEMCIFWITEVQSVREAFAVSVIDMDWKACAVAGCKESVQIQFAGIQDAAVVRTCTKITLTCYSDNNLKYFNYIN